MVFPDHTHFFSYSSIILIKISQKIRIELFRGWGSYHAIPRTFKYKSFGILTSTVWSVVAGHVVIAIHRVHSLETNRAWSISRQILV